MKNYKFTVNGNQYEVEIVDIDGNMATIEVNGTTYNVEIHHELPKLKPIQPITTQKTQKTVAPASGRGEGKVSQVKAPLPGVIIQVLVRPGDEVASGQTLCTLETMKMENAIKSEAAGRVTKVNISQGQSVLQDEVLIELN
ncbi:MAG: biotin/lipoyl-binding protein [Bacteroidales bacterium]|jgi:biotin carboxyl carrier protein|nr:biotin/lipoyl-binding protein [Bacteroidales bacterium]